jgi:hypothetical protein
LFRLLGADGVVIPADTLTAEPPQLGGDQTVAPEWWPRDSVGIDSTTGLDSTAVEK